ncbi:MAG TPA: hypothetical protein VF531_13245 [Bacillota bacterium]
MEHRGRPEAVAPAGMTRICVLAPRGTAVAIAPMAMPMGTPCGTMPMGMMNPMMHMDPMDRMC